MKKCWVDISQFEIFLLFHELYAWEGLVVPHERFILPYFHMNNFLMPIFKEVNNS